MTLSVRWLIICFIFFFSCTSKTIQEKMGRSGPISLEDNRIEFYFEKSTDNLDYETINGYHEFIWYLSSPSNLASFFKNFESDTTDVNIYITNLQSNMSEGRRFNAIAVFGELFWNFVDKSISAKNLDTLNGQYRSISFSRRIFEENVINRLSKEYLFNPPITIALDFSGLFVRDDSEVVFDKVTFQKNLISNFHDVLKDYVHKSKTNGCPSYPLTNNPQIIDSSLKIFEDLGIDFSEFRKHLSQYILRPQIVSSISKTPTFELSVETDINSKNFVRIPVPIGAKTNTHSRKYFQNAIRAVIGNMLTTGISREFMILVSLDSITHRKHFEKYTNEILSYLRNDMKESYSLVENATINISNPKTIFFRVSIDPHHTECKGVADINNALEVVSKKMDEMIRDNPATKNYNVSNKWQQILIVKSYKSIEEM